MEKVSIIIPIYNVEKYLEKCLKSVIRQTYSNTEILLIDDGSTDLSAKISDEYQKRDDRIRVFHKKNGGVSSARNLGIEKAKGEWLTFVDPDDWLEENMIEKSLQIAKKYKADIVQCNNYYNKEKEQTKRKPIKPDVLEREGEKIELLQLDILSLIYEETENKVSVGPIRGVCGKLYRKSLVENVKFKEQLYAFEDGNFNLITFEKAKKIVLFNQYLYHYRRNQKSACNSYKSTWLEQIQEILKEVKNFIVNYKNENQKFEQMYNTFACELFSSCLTRYFFHDDNPRTLKEKKEQLKDYIKTETYQEVFKNINYKYLNAKQKLIVHLAKKEKIYLIYKLYQLKRRIKK